MRGLVAIALAVSVVFAGSHHHVAFAGAHHSHHHRHHHRRHHHHHHHHRHHFRHPHVFGTKPLPISIGVTHAAPNGPSDGATVSGDNRKMRLVAFASAASNLVRGDTNHRTDIFVWHRPRGRTGLRLNHLTGWLRRVSINNHYKQANGSSINPSLDGSIHTLPHCVAFQSHATNLSARDHRKGWDIYVRDLRAHRTYLVSSHVRAPATHPSIDGQCHRVAFQAGGWIWVGDADGGGKPHRIARGSRPDFARDGRALVWTHRGLVLIRRAAKTSVVGHGTNPHVSDEEYRLWGVVFDTRRRLLPTDHDHFRDVYMRVLGRRGGPRRTILVSLAPGGDAFNGGITVYGQNRGIVTFAIRENHGWGLWYFNKHTGHVDDLAFARHGNVSGIATSARANFVAFTTRQRISRFSRWRLPTVYFKHLVDGESYRHAY